MNRLMSTTQELDFYVSKFTATGLTGPCNWYRTREVNWEEEKALSAENSKGLKQPTLFVQCLNDNILIPEMSTGMEDKILAVATAGHEK